MIKNSSTEESTVRKTLILLHKNQSGYREKSLITSPYCQKLRFDNTKALIQNSTMFYMVIGLKNCVLFSVTSKRSTHERFDILCKN